MQIKKENILDCELYIEGQIIVEVNSKEHEYLNNLYLNQTSVPGLLEDFGYNGATIIISKHLFSNSRGEFATFVIRDIK